MKKLLVGLFMMFVCVASATTIKLDWFVDGNTYAQTTCESGGNLNIPSTPPTKRGYHFIGWGLPDYTQLEYIESTGTQYIDTGYKSSNNTKVKAQISCPNVGVFVFGSRNDISGVAQKRFGLFFNTTWNPQYANQNGTGGFTTEDTIYNIEMSQDGFYVNGSLETSFVSETFSGDYNMYLFANNTADTTIGYGSCKIYSFEIYTNNVLEHKYIPCKNPSNVLGMYDTVSQTFFTNQGTGDFIAGPVSANQTLE